MSTKAGESIHPLRARKSRPRSCKAARAASACAAGLGRRRFAAFGSIVWLRRMSGDRAPLGRPPDALGGEPESGRSIPARASEAHPVEGGSTASPSTCRLLTEAGADHATLAVDRDLAA